MIERIVNEKLKENTNLFSGRQVEMTLASILEENTSSEQWLIHQAGDKLTIFIWDQGNNIFYIAGDPLVDDGVSDLRALILGEIRDRSLDADVPRFKVQAQSESLRTATPDLFGKIDLHEIKYLFHTFRKSRANKVPTPDLAGLRFQLIDASLLEDENLKFLIFVQDEINWMWPSSQKYCDYGIGIAALHQDSIIAWCTSEYMSRKKCGIGIETRESYQGVGIATSMAAQLVDYALERNIVPHWDCSSTHKTSMRVAKKVGFELVEENLFWYGAFE